MKKIINGKVYDTEKAKHVGGSAGGDGFHAWEEDLYQKRTGEFFLYGMGGPATKYAHYVDENNAWSGGDKIIPLPYEKAREWVEEHMTADEYEEIFGLPDEDAGTKALYIQIDSALLARIRQRAAENGQTLNACVTDIFVKAMMNQ